MYIDEQRLSEFLAMISNLCPDCQAKIRGKIGETLLPRSPEDITAERIYPIICGVAEEFNIPAEVLVSPNLHKNCVAARRQIALRARARGFSYPAIGRALRRHHTTIVALVKRGIEDVDS